jgi:hypothetical protein
MTARNKRLLISKSHGDSNRCTPCRGKPDQHVTHFSRSVHVWSKTVRISRDPHIATFHKIVNNDGQSHCLQEKGLLTQSTARRLTDPRVRTQFLSWASHRSGGGKVTLCWWQTTRLTGPITSACDRYVQYLLTGSTHRSLTDTGRSYSLEGASFPYTTPWPSQPTFSPFRRRALPGLQFNQNPTIQD